MTDAESPRPRRHRSRHGESSRRNQQRKRRSQARRPRTGSEDARGDRERRSQERRSKSLSAGALAQLNKDNARQQRHKDREQRRRERERDRERERERERGRDRARERYLEREREREREQDRDPEDEGTPLRKPRKHNKSKKSRVVSGAVMEEGRTRGFGLRGGGHSRDNSGDSLEKEDFYYQQPRKKKSRKKLWIILGIIAVILLIVIIVAAVVSQKNKNNNNSGSSSGSSGLSGISPSDIPAQWQGTYLDPFTWASTTDFNVTFTDQMVGDLPVMGLYSNWDDSAQANSNVPPLNKPWGSYTSLPARGVNLGGWLSLEPFITPSLFNYAPQMGVIDEWTLCQHLGSSANKTLENHYATFVTEQTFKDIQAAGLDHVRIPFSYWAVQVYPGDPYIFRTSWRYLLRAIEWARKYGLRVNLDLHGLPGSQNGWNHSGRWGPIGWLNGTDGQLNAQRSLDIHDRLSQFFAQPRYKNIITHYGLVNEPRMTFLKVSDVINWTESAYKLVRKNGVNALVIFGDGFMGLNNWQGLLQGYDGLVLDVHQYIIFNQNQIDFTHQEKVQYACTGWTEQAVQSQDTSTGYGPTLFAEWSQADTDCAQYVTNVGWGNRWEGTLNTGNASTSILTPMCPTKNSQCSCANANADPSRWSAQYKSFLLMFAEAQMHSFEKGWGWWYWTWKTESAAQWSYEAGMKAGVLPSKAYQRDFDCSQAVPDFAKNGLPEYY